MILNQTWYMDDADSEKTELIVENGAKAIGSDCWKAEGWENIKDKDGNTVMQQQVIIEGCFEALTVPDSVIRIEDRAFCRMPTLRQISILNNVTEIGKDAFKSCEQLAEVIAPKCKISAAKDPETKHKLAAGFCTHEELFASEIAEDYLKYLKTNRKKLWQEPVFLQKLLEKRLIPLDEFDDFLEKAAEMTTEEVRSMLLEYMNDAPQKATKTVANKKEKAAERAVIREKPTDDELKTLWSVKKVDAGTIELTAYHGTNPDVEVPEIIGKQTVVRINGTFKGNTSLRSILIPKTVTEISSGAFDGCNSLSNMALPEKLKLIGVSAFKGCSSLTSIKLPKSVTKICPFFAANCTALIELHLSEKIREIPSNIVDGCVSLVDLYLPEKCKTINNFAFVGLNNLRHLHIPASADKIGYDAISDCPNLTIHAPAGSYAEQYAKEHNIPFIAE